MVHKNYQNKNNHNFKNGEWCNQHYCIELKCDNEISVNN